MSKGGEKASKLIRFWCRCGRRLKVPRAAIGKRARCPQCQHEFNVPAPSTVKLEGSRILSGLRIDQL